MAKNLIKLSSALEDLRNELALAQKEGAGKDIKFEIQEVSLDLQVVATGEVDGEAKVGWGILSAKAGAKASEATTHKLNLKLTVAPGGDGKPRLISGEGSAPDWGD